MEDVPYGRILREGWVVIIVLALVGAVGAWGLTRVLPATYSATTTLMLQVDSKDASLFERNEFSLARIKTYQVLVDGPEVIGGVRSELGAEVDGYTDPQLRQMISAQITDDTVLLQVGAEAPSAKLAMELANSSGRHLSALIRTMENTDVSSRPEVELVQVLPASEPASPDSPQVTAITGLGFIAGLALGAIAAVYRTTTDRRLLAISDVRRATGLPVVGQIPKLRRSPGELASEVRVSFQELIGNMPVLAGHSRDLYALVPASDTTVDEDALAGVLEAYASKGVLACALDLREGRGPLASARSWDELLEESASGPGHLSQECDSPNGCIYAVEGVVSASDLRYKVPSAVRALRARCDVVVVVSDSESSTLQAKLAQLGASFVVVVRHKGAATELFSAVTRLRVMDLNPFGVLMMHAPRGARENLAETWRWTDGERGSIEEHPPISLPQGVGVQRQEPVLAEAHGRRASG